MPYTPIFRESEVEEGVAFSNGKEGSEKCLSRVAVLLSLITLAAVVSLSVVIVQIVGTQKRDQELQIFLQEGEKIVSSPTIFACVPCVKLLQNPTDEIDTDPLLKQLHVKVTDGREDCCASTSQEITALFESVMRLTASPTPQLPTYNMTGYKFSPVSAHKTLYPETLSDNYGIPNFPSAPVVCELKDDDHYYGLEHHKGVSITKQGLQIIHGGLYYIYTSIQFRPQSTHPCEDFKYQTFSAYVERRSIESTYSQNLLKVSHTCCNHCNNFIETGFTGGVFVLQPGDLVRVKVSGYELVHFQPESSFMGLAMLGAPESDSSSD